MTAITNAVLRGQAGHWTIKIGANGRIDSLAPSDAAAVPAQHASPATDLIDARGGLVLPSYIDLHLHLDLAYSLPLVPENKSGTLLEAIGHWSAAKRSLSAESTRERAIRAIHEEARFGTGRIRTHVDVATAAGLRLCEGVLAARQATGEIMDIQVVAFPQDGIIQDPGALDQMKEAMRMGCDLIGGIAHNEPTAQDSRRHIDLLFDLAEEFDADIDCHIDETDDPFSQCTEYLAARTLERGWQDRVTASHVCALSSYPHPHAEKVIALLAKARVHVVTNPSVNLHLQGRYDRYPKRRGLTRVGELLAAGVNVSAGQDCINDPFYPLGTGNMLDVGHMLIHADHLSTPANMEKVMDCITDNPARAMHETDYGLTPGAWADLVVLRSASVGEAFRTRSEPIHVFKRGRRLTIQQERP